MKRIGTIQKLDSRKQRFTRALEIFQELDDTVEEERAAELKTPTKTAIYSEFRVLKDSDREITQENWNEVIKKTNELKFSINRQRNRAAVQIQKVVRGYLQRKYYKRAQIEKNVKGLLKEGQDVEVFLKALKNAQAIARGFIIRKRIAKWKESVQKIEVWYKLQTNIRNAERRRRFKIISRRKVTRELISSEETYLQSMETCVKTYISRIRELISSDDDEDTPFNEQDLRLIFGDYEEFIKISKYFMVTMRLRFDIVDSDEYDVDVCEMDERPFSDLLSKMMQEMMNPYARYSACHASTVDYVNERMKSMEFAEMLESLRTESEGKVLDIFSYLILPIQRIPRYELLLRELIKFTPKEHSDFLGIQKAQHFARSVARNANRITATLLSYYRIKEIEDKTVGISRATISSSVTRESIINGKESNMVRIFVESEMLIKEKEIGKLRGHAVLLTNEILLLRPRAQKEQMEYTVVARLSLLTTNVEDVPESSVEFLIRSRGLVYNCTCANPREKEHWVKTSLVLITRAHTKHASQRKRTVDVTGKRKKQMLGLTSRSSYVSFSLDLAVDQDQLMRKSQMNVCLIVGVPMLQLRRAMMFDTNITVKDAIKEITEKLEVTEEMSAQIENSELYYKFGDTWMAPDDQLNSYGLKPMDELEFKPLTTKEFVTYVVDIPQMSLKKKMSFHPNSKVGEVISEILESTPQLIPKDEEEGAEVVKTDKLARDYQLFSHNQKTPLDPNAAVVTKKNILILKSIDDPDVPSGDAHRFVWSYGKLKTVCAVCEKKMSSFRVYKCSKCGCCVHKKCYSKLESVCSNNKE